MGPQTASLGHGAAVPGATACRHCGAPLELTVVDLGQVAALPDRAHDRAARAGRGLLPAPRARLRAVLARPDRASSCRPRSIFTEYAYFSAYSDSWVEHARALRRGDDRASAVSGPTSFVVELASNDGYLLQHFLPHGHPGARHRAGAERRGGRGRRAASPTLTEFFGRELAGGSLPRSRRADLVARQQRPRAGAGHQRLRRRRRERCSRPRARRRSSSRTWRSCSSTSSTTRSTTSTSRTSRSTRSARSSAHRGSRSSTSRSSRATAARCASSSRTPRRASSRRPPSRTSSPARTSSGLRDPADLRAVRRAACASRSARCSSCSIGLRREGKQVVGYGAPGKGNTLLNYCGIRTDFLDYTVDRNPYKQGKLHARDAHPDPSAGADRRDAART